MMSREEIIGIAKEDISIGDCFTTGIYFLIHDAESVEFIYVGQSINVFERVRQHADKLFNKIAFIPTAENKLDDWEAHYIVSLSPRHNKTLPKNTLYSSVGEARRYAAEIVNQYVDRMKDDLSVYNSGNHSYMLKTDSDKALGLLQKMFDDMSASELIALGE